MSTLDKYFVGIAELYCDILFQRKCFHYVLETGEVWGYSKGKGCTALLYKIDPARPIYHIYPINDDEIATYRETFTSQDEEGEPRTYDNVSTLDELQ